MKKMVILAGLAAMMGITGCQMMKDMQEKQAAQEAAIKKEMAEKGPIRYWMDTKGSPEMVAKAQNAKVMDRDMLEALEYSVKSYLAARESLQKTQVIQDGVAVWNRALEAQSEKTQKELKDFTAADRKAAYDAVVVAAQAADATEATKKDYAALVTYLQWGRALEASAAAQARERNKAFVKAFVMYSAKVKKMAEKYKKDKMKMAAATADGLQALSWLGYAGEAAQIEAEAMENAKAASEHLQDVAK